jgi:hypothetical protein
MCARRHAELARAVHHADQLANDRHSVGDAIAVLLVLLATAAILALAGLVIVGVLNAIAWVVGR